MYLYLYSKAFCKATLSAKVNLPQVDTGITVIWKSVNFGKCTDISFFMTLKYSISDKSSLISTYSKYYCIHEWLH